VHRLGFFAVLGALAVAGCGGNTQTQPPVPGAGQGVGAGLRADGLMACVGPLAGDGGASVALYAQPGFAAVVASGDGAQKLAIDLAEIRTHIQSAPPVSEVARIEDAWRRQALKALRRPGVPVGPCRSQAPHLPVLAPTEVVCADEVLIPLGRPAAMDRFVAVLSKLTGIQVTPAQVRYQSGGPYSAGQLITTPGSVQETRPYCSSS